MRVSATRASGGLCNHLRAAHRRMKPPTVRFVGCKLGGGQEAGWRPLPFPAQVSRPMREGVARERSATGTTDLPVAVAGDSLEWIYERLRPGSLASRTERREKEAQWRPPPAQGSDGKAAQTAGLWAGNTPFPNVEVPARFCFRLPSCSRPALSAPVLREWSGVTGGRGIEGCFPI